VSQDSTRVRGSHGRSDLANAAASPLLIGPVTGAQDPVEATAVAGLIERLLA
jgi:hypothetical protein